MSRPSTAQLHRLRAVAVKLEEVFARERGAIATLSSGALQIIANEKTDLLEQLRDASRIIATTNSADNGALVSEVRTYLQRVRAANLAQRALYRDAAELVSAILGNSQRVATYDKLARKRGGTARVLSVRAA